MPTWTFIRHGQSVANAQGWFAGQRDAPLTAEGRAQAERARHHVAGRRFDRTMCSDLSRAHETAQIILGTEARHLEVTATLRERTCGAWEGRAIAQLEAEGVMPIFASWDGRPGGGESLRDVARRVCTLFATLPDVESTLVVSHGALMRAVLGLLDGRGRDEIGLWRPKNCEVIERRVDRARWQALAEGLSERP